MIIVVFPGTEEVGGLREGLEFSVQDTIWLVPARLLGKVFWGLPNRSQKLHGNCSLEL